MRDSPTIGADHGLTYLIIAPGVTAEAAGSSPVVPAIHSKRVERISLHPFSSIRSVFRCAPVHDLVILTLVGESARTKPLVRRTLREPGCHSRDRGFYPSAFRPTMQGRKEKPLRVATQI